MCVMHVASAIIILTFDLEHLADGNVSVSQTVAGYFVLLLQCVFVSIGNLSVGYDAIHFCLLLDSECVIIIVGMWSGW